MVCEFLRKFLVRVGMLLLVRIGSRKNVYFLLLFICILNGCLGVFFFRGNGVLLVVFDYYCYVLVEFDV